MLQILIPILIVVFGAVSYMALSSYLKLKKKEEAPAAGPQVPNDEQPTLVSAEELLKELGVEIKRTDDKGAYLVGYQGGLFSFLFNKDSVRLYFSGFHEASYPDSLKACLVANSMNVRFAVWNCYLLTDDTEEKAVRVNLSCTVPLMESCKPMADYLREIMQLAFHIAREYRDEFDKMDQEIDGVDSMLMNREFRHKMALVRNKLITCNVDEDDKLRENPICAQFTLADVVATFSQDLLGDLQRMTVLKDKELSETDDTQAIVKLDVVDFLRVDADETPVEHVIFRLCFEKAEMLVSLVKIDGSTTKTLFYEMATNITPLRHDVILPTDELVTKRTLIEVRLTTENEDYWEAKYMIDEANDFLKGNSDKAPGADKRIMLAVVHPNFQQDMYWGEKFYCDRCYLQALLHFQRVLDYYKQNWESLDDRAKTIYYQLCYNIGFIYMEQREYEKAFYYLYKTRGTDRLGDLQEFINCLCNMKDPDTAPYLQSLIDRMLDMRKENEEEYENFHPFYLFLLRRLAYVLINQRQYGQAEALLHHMIEKDENADFAKKELEYLHQLRKENNETE